MDLDQPSISRLAELFPPFAEKMRIVYELIYKKYGLHMRATCGLRTFEDQDELYCQGRPGYPGKIVTNARGGESIHNFGLAIDSCFRGNDPYLVNTSGSAIWKDFGEICQMQDMEWGGVWPSLGDKDHVEFKFGFSIKELQEMYANGGLPNVYRILGDKWQTAKRIQN